MNWRWITVVGLGCAVLAGCAEPAHNASNVDPAIALDLLGSGVPLLRCRDACLDDWRKAEPKAEQLAAAGQWRDLAKLVIAVGYQDDLAVFYLGEAAEGLGYKPAAVSYYRQSTTLSGTSIACRYLSKLCGGVGLPQAAAARIAALDKPVKRPQYRLPAPTAAPQPTPAAATEPPADFQTPPPGAPAVAPLAPAPAPLPPVRNPAGEEFIEPPPANR
jgi:hypothetical protein